MRRIPPRTVADIMTRDVVTLAEHEPLANLAGSLKALRFRHLPVTDDDRLIGLVSERDLLSVSASTLLPHRGDQDRFLNDRFTVGDIMTRQVVSVPPSTSLKQAAALLLAHRIGCLPVVSEQNELLGIVTSSDLLRLVAEFAAEAD